MKDLTLFIERLKELMDDKGINIYQLSKEIKCDNQAISRWFEGKYYPRPYVLIALSIYFNCSINYILGRSDLENIPATNSESNFHEKFCECLETNNLTAYKVAKLCNIGQSTITKWTKHSKMPETSTLIKLANLFECSVDYLLGITVE